MDPIKKDGKLPYEPPKIYELDVDLAQAMGASKCSTGTSASGSTCKTGSAPSSCSKGSTGGTTTCSKGNNTYYCWTGTGRQ